MAAKRGWRISAMISVVIIGITGYAIYWAFYDLVRMPKGDFLTEEISPNGAYTVRAYLVNGGRDNLLCDPG